MRDHFVVHSIEAISASQPIQDCIQTLKFYGVVIDTRRTDLYLTCRTDFRKNDMISMDGKPNSSTLKTSVTEAIFSFQTKQQNRKKLFKLSRTIQSKIHPTGQEPGPRRKLSNRNF